MTTKQIKQDPRFDCQELLALSKLLMSVQAIVARYGYSVTVKVRPTSRANVALKKKS